MLNVLQKGNEITREQKLFKTFKHNVFTINQTKIALSSYDDLIIDKITSVI